MFIVSLDTRNLAGAFSRVALGLSAPSSLLMEGLGVTLGNEVRDQINEGGRPKWAPLNPKTVARKIKLGKNNGILRFTGELLNPANRSVVTQGHIVTLAFSKEYGKYHQTGTHRMPARPLAVVDASMTTALGDAVADFIELCVKET